MTFYVLRPAERRCVLSLCSVAGTVSFDGMEETDLTGILLCMIRSSSHSVPRIESVLEFATCLHSHLLMSNHRPVSAAAQPHGPDAHQPEPALGLPLCEEHGRGAPGGAAATGLHRADAVSGGARVSFSLLRFAACCIRPLSEGHVDLHHADSLPRLLTFSSGPVSPCEI